MIRTTPVTVALCVAAATLLMAALAHAQAPVDVYELADYRLTTEVFERFVQASSRVADVTRDDASFTYAPLFTKDVALSGDAVAAVTGLVARLEHHAALAASLDSAKITPREYAKFAITLIAAVSPTVFSRQGSCPVSLQGRRRSTSSS